MGFPSYLEDIEERRHENLAMTAALDQRLSPKLSEIAAPPTVATAKLSVIVTRRPVEETIARRTSGLRDTHILAMAELMPRRPVGQRQRSAA
jgi:hypothetical protein